MSTCQGAPAPHEDCPAGDRCDWSAGPWPRLAYPPGTPAPLPTPEQKSALRDLIEAQGHPAGGPYVPNRADRRAAKRARRR